MGRPRKNLAEPISIPEPAMAESPTPKIIPRSLLDEWEAEGIPCYYAKFQSPIPPVKDKEPVFEFQMGRLNSKYGVDSLTYTDYGLIWKSGNEKNLMPLTNVAFVRPILS